MTLRHGTAYWDLNTDRRIFDTAIRALAKGNSLRGTARIVQIDKDTACQWLTRAAQHCRLVMLWLWRDLAVRECQLDELWSFIQTEDASLESAKWVYTTYGEVWGFHYGAWCWPLWWAGVPRPMPTGCCNGWPMSPPMRFPFSPAIRGSVSHRSVAGLRSMGAPDAPG